MQVKARQGLGEQLTTIASSVLTIEPKNAAEGQLSPAAEQRRPTASHSPPVSPQQATQHYSPYSNGDPDADGLVDVPLSTPSHDSSAAKLAKENSALKARLQVC